MRASCRKLADRISIQIKDQSYQFHPLWLRLNDPAQITRNGQRLFEMSDVVNNPSTTKARHFRMDDDRGLEVEWADGCRSTYTVEWMESQVKVKSMEPQLWHKGCSMLLPEMQYEELDNEEGRTSFSIQLARYGIALLRNVPTEHGMVEEVGNMIGNVRTTNYGALFDVIDKGSQGNNLAQTNCRIPSHTDNPYRDPFPGVQLLHCLKNAFSGGATTFVDGFAAAETLRHEDPSAFALLAETPHPFEYVDPEQNVLLRAHVPVVSVDTAGKLTRIAFNNRSAVPLEGPSEKLEEYYCAWAKFDAICNDDQRIVRILLRPGDLAVFLNSRVMHGRDEYEAGGERHFQGAYVDHDAIFSRVSMAQLAGAE